MGLLHLATVPKKFARWANEIRLRRVKSGLGPDEIAPLGRLRCPLGTNKILCGRVASILQHARLCVLGNKKSEEIPRKTRKNPLTNGRAWCKMEVHTVGMYVLEAILPNMVILPQDMAAVKTKLGYF